MDIHVHLTKNYIDLTSTGVTIEPLSWMYTDIFTKKAQQIYYHKHNSFNCKPEAGVFAKSPKLHHLPLHQLKHTSYKNKQLCTLVAVSSVQILYAMGVSLKLWYSRVRVLVILFHYRSNNFATHLSWFNFPETYLLMTKKTYCSKKEDEHLEMIYLWTLVYLGTWHFIFKRHSTLLWCKNIKIVKQSAL